MKPITRKKILLQLKNDLIGKDSYRGVTLTYSWLANQFGHFSLGFIPSLLIYNLLVYWKVAKPELWAAVIIAAAWLIFEVYNCFYPLLKNQETVQQQINAKKYVFETAWKNVVLDTFTDLCFFWLGAFCAYGYLSSFKNLNWPGIILLVALIIVTIWLSSYWYPVKMYLQAAQYPFQFRLSQWNKTISKADKEAVEQLLNNNTTGNHLLIFGTRKTGKTGLSVGLATEFSIKHHACTYTTAIKLLSMFEEDEKEQDALNQIWTWQKASVLIIDDINPGSTGNDEVLMPRAFKHFLNHPYYSKRNGEALKRQNVIWVLGNENQYMNKEKDWTMLLQEIGVPTSHIYTINLTPRSNPQDR